jgi:hypothetical protein
MTARSLPTSNGTYRVEALLSRPGGGVDAVVAYRQRGGPRSYAAYRHGADGGWTVLDGGWGSLEKAIADAPGLREGAPLRLAKLLGILNGALVLDAGLLGATS